MFHDAKPTTTVANLPSVRRGATLTTRPRTRRPVVIAADTGATITSGSDFTYLEPGALAVNQHPTTVNSARMSLSLAKRTARWRGATSEHSNSGTSL